MDSKKVKDKKKKKKSKEDSDKKSSSKAASHSSEEKQTAPSVVDQFIAKEEGIPSLPMEVITGRLLTHYDETACVAIPSSAVDQHRNIGNTVVPLVESYRSRYSRLRTLLTGRLLPRREHLLQLKRQLDNCSIEVSAAKKAIERETLTDSQQILERLQAVESMRQSSITQQTLRLKEELEAIERVIRRVEVANECNLPSLGMDGVLLTSVYAGGLPAVETVKGPRASSMVELIQQYGDLSTAIEHLASKALTIQVEYPTTDFPKETAERRQIVERCDAYVHALGVKDHMVWMALQEKDKATELLEEEKKLSSNYADELASWAELSQHLTVQLKAEQEARVILERRNQELINILRKHNIHYA